MQSKLISIGVGNLVRIIDDVYIVNNHNPLTGNTVLTKVGGNNNFTKSFVPCMQEQRQCPSDALVCAVVIPFAIASTPVAF